MKIIKKLIEFLRRLLNRERKAKIVAVHLFYEGSSWEDEIATDKRPLLCGGHAIFDNVSSYLHGINGIMIDVQNLDSRMIAMEDMTFRAGLGNNRALWSLVDRPTMTIIRNFEGNDLDRLMLTWDSDLIVNRWLEVTIDSEVISKSRLCKFYFGSLVAGLPCADPLIVAKVDVNATSANVTQPGKADITNPYDFDRDKGVTSNDMIIARDATEPSLSRITV